MFEDGIQHTPTDMARVTTSRMVENIRLTTDMDVDTRKKNMIQSCFLVRASPIITLHFKACAPIVIYR